MNVLRAENIQLKTKVLQSEKELQKKDKDIKDLWCRVNAPAAGIYNNIPKETVPKKTLKTSAHLVMGLKKRIQEIQKENKTLRDGLEALRKSLKMTTTQELDAEVKAYAEECARLRKILEEGMQEKPYITQEDISGIEEKLKQQNEIIGKLTQENQELAQKVATASEEAKNWKEKAEQKKFSPKISEGANQALAKEQMKEIQKLKDQIESMKKAAKSQQQAEELQKTKADLTKQEREHEEKIRELEMKLAECKHIKDAEIKSLKDQMKSRDKSKESEHKQEKQQLDEEQKNVEKVNLLELKDVSPIALEMRLNLIMANVPSSDLRKTLFKNCDDDEKISIHEIARILKRGPTSLKAEDALNVARYIVEPRAEQLIEYDELQEESLSAVTEDLTLLLGEYTIKPITEPASIQQSLVEKLKEKIVPMAEALQENANDAGFIRGDLLDEINTKQDIGLSKEEIDYMLLAMYKDHKDMSKLSYADLLEHLGTIGCQIEIVEEGENPEPVEAPVVAEEPLALAEEEPSAPMEEEPSAPVEEEPSAPVEEEPSAPVEEEPSAPVEEAAEPIVETVESPETQIISEEAEQKAEPVSLGKEEPVRITEDLGGENLALEENNIEEVSKKEPAEDKPLESEKVEEKPSPEDKKMEEMTEEQMIGIAQKCFSGIAEKMASQGLTVTSLFKDQVYHKSIESEDVSLLSPENFMKGLKKLGLEEFTSAERGCLEKMLAADDTEKGFRVKDLVQILEDYGITESGKEDKEQDDEAVKEMQFEDLDNISMVLLLALTEYLVSAKTPLYDLFGNVIYKQPVQVDDKELEVDIINSPDFFEVLHGIGIDTEEKEHDNLKTFLCIDPSYSDKFSVDKLKAAIEEFAVNEELRAHAQQCYQELVEEEQVEEEPVEEHKAPKLGKAGKGAKTGGKDKKPIE